MCLNAAAVTIYGQLFFQRTLPSPILSRVKLFLFYRSQGAKLLALAWLRACFSRKLLQNKAVVSGKKLSLTSVGISISPNSGNQPGNMQSGNNYTSSVIPITQIYFFSPGGTWEENFLSLWRLRNRVRRQQRKKTTAPSGNTYSLQFTNMHHRNNTFVMTMYSLHLIAESGVQLGKRRDALDSKFSPRLTFIGVFLSVWKRSWKLWEDSEARRWSFRALHWFLAINSPTTNLISVRHVHGAGCLQSTRFFPGVKAKGGRARVTVAIWTLELLAFLPAIHSWGHWWLLSSTAGTQDTWRPSSCVFSTSPGTHSLYMQHNVHHV